MLNPFINAGLEVALKELFKDQFNTEQIYQVTDLKKTHLIIYVYPNRLCFVFTEEKPEPIVNVGLPDYQLSWQV
ncbi:hypothetical protein P7G51_10315 [Enterococcus asini]|uniref:hypothetical protein n=1 Tax=Enterococcus asini TaxID=57732 RepID=UPI00288CF382|nr:hypothetical protein [Enterococcus asini]MDT2757774.1 hypothetical protein [Enterococcus asini]